MLSLAPVEPLDMSGQEDCVGALTVKTSPEYAMKHGACKINEKVRERREEGRG